MSSLILVVEEETILGDSICTYLEHHGYATMVARSGAEGVRMAEENAPAIATLRQQIARIAALESAEDGPPTVLVREDTGAGKEMVARAIHFSSSRTKGPFVEINCAAIPAALLEAELFSHEKGACTDARTAKPGLFESADGGTLFLDEIGHLDLGLQVKLLKVIEEKSVRRVGGLRMITFNARIVAATNRNLEAAIAAEAFRPDLYYRIKAITLEVPPLRSRGADITLFAKHFLERSARRYGLPAKHLSPAAEDALRAYAWPGNVRELAHLIERAVLLHEGPTITADHLGLSRAPRRLQSRSTPMGCTSILQRRNSARGGGAQPDPRGPARRGVKARPRGAAARHLEGGAPVPDGEAPDPPSRLKRSPPLQVPRQPRPRADASLTLTGAVWIG